MKRLFATDRLEKIDYVCGISFLTACFVLFFHGDISGVGWDSLNYIFGSPVEFYENCKQIRGRGQNMLGTPYPPPIYVIFALWLYPFKLLGWLTDPKHFPIFLTYWLKTLTTIVYFFSGRIFYKIALKYSPNKDWAKYAAVAWLTMPIALFSQFIFSQYDIFYVVLTMAGFLMFLQNRLYWASLLFGLAITFKYFPAFVFMPLLLLFEKRLLRILLYCTIFIIPTLLIHSYYGQSAAFIEGVRNHGSIARVYGSSLTFGAGRIYLLFTSFTILCGIAYFTELINHTRVCASAYFWLISSILPFIFIFWHPQWLMFIAPAITLTTVINWQQDKFFLLDLFGMFLFVVTVSLLFQNNVDTAMFRGSLFGFPFDNSYLMARLYNWFNEHSLNVFLSGFWGYLILQTILKYRFIGQIGTPQVGEVNYNNIRQSLYVGLLIFLLPAFFAIYKDFRSQESVISNKTTGKHFGELLNNRTFEQTFIAKGKAIKGVNLLLATFARQNRGEISLNIVDASENSLLKSTRSMDNLQDNDWVYFVFDPINISKGARYRLKLTSATGVLGNAITWWASSVNSYDKGEAIVDGAPQKSDFAFEVVFSK